MSFGPAKSAELSYDIAALGTPKGSVTDAAALDTQSFVCGRLPAGRLRAPPW